MPWCVKSGRRWCAVRGNKRPGMEREGSGRPALPRDLVRTLCGGNVPASEVAETEPDCSTCIAKVARRHPTTKCSARTFSTGRG